MLTAAHPRLVAAKERVTCAEAMLERAKQDVQAECLHELVAHHAETSSIYCSTPRRICFKCRLEEQGTHWSYNATGHWQAKKGDAALGHDAHRVIVDMSDRSDDFYALRRITQ